MTPGFRNIKFMLSHRDPFAKWQKIYVHERPLNNVHEHKVTACSGTAITPRFRKIKCVLSQEVAHFKKGKKYMFMNDLKTMFMNIK